MREVPGSVPGVDVFAYLSGFGESGVWIAGEVGHPYFAQNVFFDDCGMATPVPARAIAQPERLAPAFVEPLTTGLEPAEVLPRAPALAHRVLAGAEPVSIEAKVDAQGTVRTLSVILRGPPPEEDPARCLVMVLFEGHAVEVTPLRSRTGCQMPAIAPPRCSLAALRAARPPTDRLDLPEDLTYLVVGSRGLWLRHRGGQLFDPLPDDCPPQN
jgi:hypothetical protein